MSNKVLIEALREGTVEHPKRWSGDGGRIDDEATEELMHQAADALEAMSWQPIEAAPKDGTWFLGFEPRKDFCDQFRVWRWVETISFVGFEDAADTNDFDEQPTKWKPITPPENKGESE